MLDLPDDGKEVYQEEARWAHLYEVKEEAQNQLSTIVHRDFIEDFSKFFAFAYLDGMSEARKLADKLKLSKQHFLAMEENEREFTEFVTDYSYWTD